MTKQEIIDYMYKNHVQGDFKIEEMAEDLAKPDLQPTCNDLATDTISRSDAIDAVEFGITYAKAIDVNTGESKELFKEGNDALRKAVERLKELPSAESELPTCCDYDINQLITFAIACRKAGIEEKDLKKFVTDMTSIYEMIMKDIEKIMSGVIRNE